MNVYLFPFFSVNCPARRDIGRLAGLSRQSARNRITPAGLSGNTKQIVISNPLACQLCIAFTGRLKI